MLTGVSLQRKIYRFYDLLYILFLCFLIVTIGSTVDKLVIELVDPGIIAFCSSFNWKFNSAMTDNA